ILPNRFTMNSPEKEKIPVEEKELKDIAWLCGLFALFSALMLRFFTASTCMILPVAVLAFHQFYWRRRNLPPGPVPLPLIGNTLSIDMRNPAKTFSSWHAVYGPIYTVWLPHPMIVMASHEVLKEALIRQGPAFAGRPSGYIWSMFTKNPEHGDGIILCEGERWEQIREFAHKIFRYFLNVIREHKERLQMDGEPRDFMEAYLREMAIQRDNPHFKYVLEFLEWGTIRYHLIETIWKNVIATPNCDGSEKKIRYHWVRSLAQVSSTCPID
ncbi:hypothetical protein TELCIR_15065, partial [Teladorsagia circumcincta]